MHRRTALKTIGIGLAGSALAGVTMAHSNRNGTHGNEIWGESLAVGDGEVKTYATTNPAGKLASLGVAIDAEALAEFDADSVAGHLHFPDVDAHQFTFMGFHYNPQGHPPEEIYGVPHFDFHFYMMEEADVEAIETGPAQYAIPEAQLPQDYVRTPVVDTDDDGEPDTPLADEAMGEHLVDPSSPEFQPDGEFTHTLIYGAYNVDGSDVGRLTFVEPMITLAYLEALDEEVAVDSKMPEEFFVADDYPQKYVMKPSSTGGVTVAIDDFAEFSGPSA